MITRRLPMLALSVVGLVGVSVATRVTETPIDAVFSNVSAPWMPAAPLPGALTSTWFCPGVPAAGADRTAGEIEIFNSEANEMRGRLTVLGDDEAPVTQDVTVPAYDSVVVDIDALVDAPYASVVVEIDGGGGLVEQRSTAPVGSSSMADSIATCANSPSARWYFATGDTAGDSTSLLVLSNPYDDSAIVDVTLATSRGVRTPTELQGFTIPGHTVKTVDIKEIISDETDVGVSIVATRGSLVAGRAQLYSTDTRNGYAMTLGAPALQNQWWFPYGTNGDGVVETFAIYNASAETADVQPVLLLPLGSSPGDGFVPPDAVSVPAGEVVTLDVTTDNFPGLPAGNHSLALSVTSPDAEVVVERTVTRTIRGVATSTVSLGAPTRVDSFIASTWYVGIGPDEATADGLAVFNNTATDGVVTVQMVTPRGVETIPALAEVTAPQASLTLLDIPTEAVGRELIVRSTTSILVERVLPREANAEGRVATLAVPASS